SNKLNLITLMSMRLSFTVSIFLLSFLSISRLQAFHTEPESTRDTATAVVVYNADARFLPHPDYGVKDYSRMIDSLVVLDTVPVSLVNQLSVYRMLADKNAGELELVIDSIFEMENVPQPILNA